MLKRGSEGSANGLPQFVYERCRTSSTSAEDILQSLKFLDNCVLESPSLYDPRRNTRTAHRIIDILHDFGFESEPRVGGEILHLSTNWTRSEIQEDIDEPFPFPRSDFELNDAT